MRKLIALVALLPGISFAANITNNITGVGPNNSVKPSICIQNNDRLITLPLAPGTSGDANKASGSESYAGGAIRFGGCSDNNAYLGYVEFNINNSGNNSIKNYSPPEGVHVSLTNPAIGSSGNVTGAIEYTPIAYNPDLTPANPGKKWQFTGINLSGLEFSKSIDPVVIPNLSQDDAKGRYSDLQDTETFIKAGVNTVRVPVSWGYLQLGGAGKGPINMGYYNNYLKPLLQTLTHAKVNTIVDLHAYMRYSEFGQQYSGCGSEGPCPDGTLITDVNAYQSIWGQLTTLMQNDPSIDKKYLMIDLMNEPVGVPDDKVFTIQAALIKRLQEQKFDGYILVEGNSWSGLHSWSTFQWTGSDGQSYSNATLFTRDNFNKEGISDLSKILINVHQYLDYDYSGNNDNCQQDLSTTGSNGFNLNEFVDYLSTNKFKAIVTEFGAGRDAASCRSPLTQFMQYLQDNSAKDKDYGFVGWTIWATGHGWGDYKLRVRPSSYQMDVLQGFL